MCTPDRLATLTVVQSTLRVKGATIQDLLHTPGTLIHAYEERYEPIPESSGPEVLRFLMQEHNFVQSDLSEIGSQGVMSEILNGKRELNIRQIRMLAKRFKVSPSVFF